MTVASHTWSHYSLSNISSEMRIQQMVKNEMAINNIIGKWPTYMRPPYSDCTEESGCWADMQALGYHRVYFDLDTQDYLNPLPSQIQNSKDIVKAALAAGPDVTDYLSIQHDIVQQSVANFSSYYFDLIKAKKWKGVTVGTCLGDTDQSNWYRSFNDASLTPSAATSKTTTAKTTSTQTQPSSKTSTLKSSTTSTVSPLTQAVVPKTTSLPTNSSAKSTLAISSSSSTVTKR